MTIETGDFGAAYDHAVAVCNWPRLAVKRGTFVSDFPYSYYTRQVSEKIQAQWNGRAIPGEQPVVVFEIRRDGRLNQVAIDKSSGNADYDQVALQTINDVNLKTAKALGLTIPPSVLGRADEIIQ